MKYKKYIVLIIVILASLVLGFYIGSAYNNKESTKNNENNNQISAQSLSVQSSVINSKDQEENKENKSESQNNTENKFSDKDLPNLSFKLLDGWKYINSTEINGLTDGGFYGMFPGEYNKKITLYNSKGQNFDIELMSTFSMGTFADCLNYSNDNILKSNNYIALIDENAEYPKPKVSFYPKELITFKGEIGYDKYSYVYTKNDKKDSNVCISEDSKFTVPNLVNPKDNSKIEKMYLTLSSISNTDKVFIENTLKTLESIEGLQTEDLTDPIIGN
jgi:hypothetical protein